MRILHIGKFYPPDRGGIETATKIIIDFLWRNRISSDVVCFSSSSTIKEKNDFGTLFRFKSNVKFLSTPFSLSYLWFLIRNINNYDIIHIHVPNPISLLYLFFIKSEIRVIVHWHSDIINQRKSYLIYRPFEKILLSRAQVIIVGTKNYFESSKPLQNYKSKVSLISYCVPRTFPPIQPHEKVEAVTVVSIGRLVKYKGYEYLVEAARSISSNIKIIIIGNGPEKKHLENLIVKYQLTNIELKENVEDLSMELSKADIFCLPSVSRAESFGISLIEAMSYKLPLISTNVEGSGMNFINIHKKTGLIVRKESAEDLAEAINKLAASPELRELYSKNAYQRFLDEFEESKVMAKYLPLYS